MMVPVMFVVIIGAAVIGFYWWATGGWTVYTTQGSGIIETIPEAHDEHPAPPEGQLVLLSYPLAYGGGTMAQPPSATAVCDTLDGVIETIAAAGADIALLQEVDYASQRTCEIDQLYYIAAALGWGYAARTITWECRYVPWPWRRPLGRVRAGLGIISRYPLTQHVRRHLPPAQAGPFAFIATRFFPRHAVQMVDIQCGDIALRVFNAHVETQHPAAQQRQMRQLAAFVYDARTPSCILMGTLPDMTQNDAVSGLMDAPPNPLHAVAASTTDLICELPSTQPNTVLVGRSLQAQELCVIPVTGLISHPLPLALTLRWELPLMTVLG